MLFIRSEVYSVACAGPPSTVSSVDAPEIRQGVHGVSRLSEDLSLDKIGPTTVLDVEVRELRTKHSISLQRVERWLAGENKSLGEASKKAKLKMMLVQR